MSGRPHTPRVRCREPGCTYTTRRDDGLCRRHYVYLRNNGLHQGIPCKEPGCTRTAAAKGWCNRCYMRHYRAST